jgi:putative oxidoreductase
MDQFLGKLSGLFYALFRIVSGLLFAQHGAQKLFGWLGGMGEAGGSAPFLSLMFFAGLIEFFGGLLIAVGFQASWAAFIASGQMAVAYFMVHAPNALFPIQNRGELAVLYCFAFLYIASRGSGTLGIDSLLGKPKKAD